MHCIVIPGANDDLFISWYSFNQRTKLVILLYNIFKVQLASLRRVDSDAVYEIAGNDEVSDFPGNAVPP